MIKSVVALLLVAGIKTGVSQAPSFDAASIKPSKTENGSSSWHSRFGYIVLKNQTLKTLVGIAYGVTDDKVMGGPKWIGSERFDIEARAAGPAKDPELLLMLQNLLAERFRLTVHREVKPREGYVLVLSKSGIKVQPDKGEGKSGWNVGRGKIVAQRISMAKLADSLTRMLGMPVVDRTDVKGLYTFNLEWTPDDGHPAAPDGVLPEAPAGPTLFTVLSQDLGLKLESKKLPTEVIVIDKAEQPTEN